MHYVKARGILSARNGMNLYRGCQHGCIYCDSRSDCYQMDHRFDDIEVKENALKLLEDSLCRKRKPCMIGTGSMSDPYMPLEKELLFTRRALELIDRYGFGATLITKSNLVLRDLDLLKSINDHTKCVVQMTMTTYDETMCQKLEPGVCTTTARFETLKVLRDAGIPTVVWISPILPFLNDTMENLNGILDYCEDAGVHGVICFGMGVTLRSGSREYFYQQLERNFPGLKEKYIHYYGNSYLLDSPNDKELMRQFHTRCGSSGILHDNARIFRFLSEFEEKTMLQISLF